MRTRRADADAGSVLMLVPAAVLVLIILGAIAVDSAVVFLAQRDLSNRTAAVSNDIAAAAIADTGFYENGSVVLDAHRAASYTELAFPEDRLPGGYERWTARATTDGPQVVVEATAEVRFVFAPAIPGVSSTATVRARSVATATGG